MKDNSTSKKTKPPPGGEQSTESVTRPVSTLDAKGRSGEGAQSAMKQWLLQEKKRILRRDH